MPSQLHCVSRQRRAATTIARFTRSVVPERALPTCSKRIFDMLGDSKLSNMR